MRLTVLVMCLGLLAGCSGPQGPVISMFNGESVNVQFAPISNPHADTQVTRAMANRVCEKRGQTARHAATRTVSDHLWEYLYRCR